MGEVARDDAADEGAVVLSSERGECSRSGVEQRDVMRTPLVVRARADGESEPDAVLAVDMGELTTKEGYGCLVLSVGVEEDETMAADADGAGYDWLTARAANEVRGAKELFMQREGRAERRAREGRGG